MNLITYVCFEFNDDLTHSAQLSMEWKVMFRNSLISLMVICV